MKTIIKTIIFLLLLISVSCEDVIDVPLNDAPARLTVEASLDWEKGATGNEQTIRLSTSTPYFDTTSKPAVTGAMVKVTNDSSGAEFVFTDQNNGDYVIADFEPVVGQSYTLEIIHNGETYTATETLTGVPDINNINQATEDGFDDEAIEVHVFFTDPPEEGNNYLFKFFEEGELLPDLEEFNDEFINGNEVDWWYELEEEETTDGSEGFVPGDVLNIEFYATSEVYNDYLRILINQSGGAGPFDSTPVAIKGNVINITNPDNYAHGYFRVTQVIKTSYTIQ